MFVQLQNVASSHHHHRVDALELAQNRGLAQQMHFHFFITLSLVPSFLLMLIVGALLGWGSFKPPLPPLISMPNNTLQLNHTLDLNQTVNDAAPVKIGMLTFAPYCGIAVAGVLSFCCLLLALAGALAVMVVLCGAMRAYRQNHPHSAIAPRIAVAVLARAASILLTALGTSAFAISIGACHELPAGHLSPLMPCVFLISAFFWLIDTAVLAYTRRHDLRQMWSSRERSSHPSPTPFVIPSNEFR